MRTHHIFRPTAFDSLEDRVVLDGGARAISGLNLSDVLLVQGAVNSAFSDYQSQILTAVNQATSFESTPFTPTPPTTPTTVNPVIAPTLAGLPSSASESANQLAVQLSDLLSPLRRSTRTLIPAMQATVAGPDSGSLSNVVSSTIGRLITAVNVTQGPNTTQAENAAIQQAQSDISALRTQLFSEIAAARQAVNNQVNLFVNSPQGRAGRRARLDLSAALNAVTPAYGTFQSGLNAAVATYQSGLTTALAAIPSTATGTSLQNARNTAFTNAQSTLQATIINLTNTLNSQVGSAISGSLGNSRSLNRVRSLVRNQIIGANDGSLLDNLTEQVGTLTLPSTGSNFSTSSFVFGTNNLVAQSRVTTGALPIIGSDS